MSGVCQKKELSATEEARLEKALVCLIGSTRRNRRAKNLLEVAKELRVAEKLLGSRRVVAKRIGLSQEMLREFASVTRLDKSVQHMVKKGLLSSVDVAYRISMLHKSDQLRVAQAYVKKDLSGKDVKEVVALWKKNPECTVEEVIGQVKSSRDIVQYIIRFRRHEKEGSAMLRHKFAAILGKDNIVSLEIKGKIVNLTISEKGRQILRQEAKKHGLTKRKLIERVIERE
jgi:hypothetical protein